MNAAKKIILLLWLVIVASLGNASESTPGAGENRVWQKSFETLATRQAEPLQTLGGHQENGSAGYDYAVDSLLAAEGGGILGPEGPGQFVLQSGQGSLETAGVVRNGEFVNRVFDSGYSPGAGVSGPLGRSFAPGSGVPTTAGEAISQRGLNIFYPNNAQGAAIYQATENIPATFRTSIGGTTPEVLIDPANFGSLKPIIQYPVVP